MKNYADRLADAKVIHANGKEAVREDPVPENQKFPVGAFVKIADDLGSTMDHFKSGVYAKVDHTYGHAYGGDDVESYSLYIRYKKDTWHETAWYEEWQLTLVTDPKILKRLEMEFENRKCDEEDEE